MSGDRLDLLDYYTLLRIETNVPSDGIQAAFHAFARRYHPDRFANDSKAKRERAAQIYRRGAEGYRVLMNPRSRKDYDAGLHKGNLRLEHQSDDATRRSRPKNPWSVSNARARPFAAKALRAYNNKDYRTALLNLKLALEWTNSFTFGVLGGAIEQILDYFFSRYY